MRRFSRRKILCCGLFAAITVTVVASIYASRDDAMPPEGVLRIDGAMLFSGDLLALRPHLDFEAVGCVRIRYRGPKKGLKYGYEVWQNGVCVQPVNWGGMILQGPVDVNVAMTLKEIAATETEETIRLVESVWSPGIRFVASSDDILVRDKVEGRSFTAHTALPIECPDDEEVAVWAHGYKADDGVSIGNAQIVEAAKLAPWAFVLKVKMDEEF